MGLDEANFAEDDYDDGINKTWASSFNVDGILYATNLFWQPLQNVDDPIIDVEQAAENILEGADLYCVKSGKAPQFGICISKDGYQKNQYVAASAISSSLSSISSFVAVFKVDNGWWYICVRNDIILSDGDMLFTNEEDAKLQFESMLAVPDWNKKIAPAEWGIDATEELDLSDLMANSLPSKLQKIKALKGGKLTAVFLVSGFVILWILYSLIDSIFLTPPKKPIISVAPKKIKPVTVEKVIEIAPWENLTPPAQVMINCNNAIRDIVSIMPPGWKAEPIKCVEANASGSWKKEVGKISWIKKALDDASYKITSYSFSDNGAQAYANINFEPIKKEASAPKLNASDLLYQLNKTFQALGVNITLKRESIQTQTKKVYNMVLFSFFSSQGPTSWIQILTKYSGLYINNIQYIPTNRKWKYEGAIYVL